MSAPDRYAVMGDPVAHSLSPTIHAQFATQTGQHLSYDRLQVPNARFERELRGFFEGGGAGLNITVPHKLAACALMAELTPRAQAAGAVNTVYLRGGQLAGDNTDGAGLLWDLQRLGAPLAGARILVLGAGGAARGALGPLLAAAPAQLVIANRSEGKARELAELFVQSAGAAALSGCGYGAIPAGAFDLIINATSASLGGDLPPVPAACIATGSFAYDMMYAAEPTPFMRWAAGCGAAQADGLGMLVGQAAEAFVLWRGVRPAAEPVLTALRP